MLNKQKFIGLHDYRMDIGWMPPNSLETSRMLDEDFHKLTPLMYIQGVPKVFLHPFFAVNGQQNNVPKRFSHNVVH